MLEEGKRKLFIFLSIGILFLLAVVLLLLFFYKKTKTSEGSTITTSTVKTPVSSDDQVISRPKDTPPPPPQTTEEREKLYVRQLSRTFVERFETNSNQNQNRNIEDASELATDHMSAYIATKSLPQVGDYRGVTAKVISMDLTAFSKESATVRVGAQMEIESVQGTQTEYKNGRVELKKINGTWKIDGLFWDVPTP